MKKDYNRDVMSDMPIDASFTSSVETKTTKTSTTKPKINAIGTQKRTTSTSKSSSAKTTSKSSSAKNSASKTTTSKSSTSKSSTTKSSSVKTTASKETQKKDNEINVEETKSKKLRTKLINSDEELSDLEKLNEENIKSYRFKSRRNRVVIAILAVLLVLSIATIVTYTMITKLKTNCNMYAHGDVSAVFIVDGQEMDEFRSPSNLQGNRIFEIDIKIKIKTDEMYNIRFKPECYQKGVLMSNTLIYEHNTELFREGVDGYYYSKAPIRGNQTISLCGGVILDYYYQETLNVDNFRLDFHVYFEKV